MIEAKVFIINELAHTVLLRILLFFFCLLFLNNKILKKHFDFITLIMINLVLIKPSQL
jgi:hypothetical protein